MPNSACPPILHVGFELIGWIGRPGIGASRNRSPRCHFRFEADVAQSRVRSICHRVLEMQMSSLEMRRQ